MPQSIGILQMWLSEQKPDVFAYKLKFIYCPQVIATPMHVHCLHWLISTGVLLRSAFSWPCKSMTGEMAPMDLIWLPLSVHVCLGLVVEYWSFVGTCGCHSHSKLYYLHHLATHLPPPTPPLCPSCPFPYVVLISMNSMKTVDNQLLSTFQVSCNYAQWMSPVPRQANVFKLNFQYSISRNNGKC